MQWYSSYLEKGAKQRWYVFHGHCLYCIPWSARMTPMFLIWINCQQMKKQH